jgi:hypothetical protein
MFGPFQDCPEGRKDKRRGEEGEREKKTGKVSENVVHFNILENGRSLEITDGQAQCMA